MYDFDSSRGNQKGKSVINKKSIGIKKCEIGDLGTSAKSKSIFNQFEKDGVTMYCPERPDLIKFANSTLDTIQQYMTLSIRKVPQNFSNNLSCTLKTIPVSKNVSIANPPASIN